MDASIARKERLWIRVAAIAGIAGVTLYVVHVVIGGILWPEYDHLEQAISDLTALGAPNRAILSGLTDAYGFLMIALASGLILFCARSCGKAGLVGSILYLLMELVSLSYALFPEDPIGSPMTMSGIMHLVVTAVIVPLSIASPVVLGIGLMRSRVSRPLGMYSIVTGAAVFAFGGLTAMAFANKAAWFGLAERLNIGCLQAWSVVLACFLIARTVTPPARTGKSPREDVG